MRAQALGVKQKLHNKLTLSAAITQLTNDYACSKIYSVLVIIIYNDLGKHSMVSISHTGMALIIKFIRDLNRDSFSYIIKFFSKA